MIFGYRELLAEKDARIAELNRQIARLELLVPAFHSPVNAGTPVWNVEHNAILDGRDDQIELTRAQSIELDEIESEASRLQSGTYE